MGWSVWCRLATSLEEVCHCLHHWQGWLIEQSPDHYHQPLPPPACLTNVSWVAARVLMTGGVYYRDSGQLELSSGHLQPQETLDLLTPGLPPSHPHNYHIITATISQPSARWTKYERNVVTAFLKFSPNTKT